MANLKTIAAALVRTSQMAPATPLNFIQGVWSEKFVSEKSISLPEMRSEVQSFTSADRIAILFDKR